MRDMARSLFALGALLLASAGFAQKHQFGIDDWADIPWATPAAVSVKGDVLYRVIHGAKSGGDVIEWHAITLQGSNDRKLDIPDKFNPTGFTKDGDLYGTFEINGTPQIATFDFDHISASSLPKSVIFLPFTANSITISPDGNRFAILANPNSPPRDTKIKSVIQPSQTSLYVVDASGANGKWWAPELKNVAQIAWNPDSGSIAILSSTPKIGYHYVKSDLDVCDGVHQTHVAQIANAVSDVAWTNG